MQLRYITKTGNARTATSLESETLFSLLFCFSALWLVSRLRLHEAKVIKDRRHHLRTYPNCFVAKELIDWLIEHKEASERDTAIKIMQKLLDQSIIHHGKAGLQQQASFFLSFSLDIFWERSVAFKIRFFLSPSQFGSLPVSRLTRH